MCERRLNCWRTSLWHWAQVSLIERRASRPSPENFAISSGLKLTEAVALEKTPDHYLNVVAVKRADKDSPWAKDIVEVYRSDDFKAVVNAKFQGYAKPSFLQ